MTDETFEGFRLSPQQLRIWALQERDGPKPYRTCGEARLEGVVDPQRLTRAWEAVVSRHEILRTTFRRLPGMATPLQVIDEVPSVLFEVEPQNSPGTFRTDESALADTPSRLVLRRSSGESTLAFDVSAMCADGPTIDRILFEVHRVYAGDFSTSVGSAEPVLQYADAAEWWNELLEKPESAAGLAYWRGLDLGPPGSQTLSFEKKADGGAFDPRRLRCELSGKSLEAMATVCSRLDVTPGAFMLACWQVLLQRLTGERPVVVGYSTDGRRIAELKEVLGPCARYVPLVARLDGDPSFGEAASRVSRDLAAQEKWTDLFTWDLQPAAAGPDGLPFFAFGFDYAEDGPTSAGRLTLSRVIDSTSDRFRVRLSCTRTDDRLTIDLVYDSAVVESREAERLLARFLECFRSAVEDPGLSIGRLEILPGEERRLLQVDWNDTDRDFADRRPIHERFEEQAARAPENVAVVCGDERITFSRLNARANRIAHRLRNAGVRPDTLVALSVERSAEMVVGLLAIWKAGGAYVPLEPSLPAERLAFLLEDTGAAFLVTRSNLVERFPVGRARTFLLDEEDGADESAENLGRAAQPEHLAYVIFTSGSTGRPKGVAVEHRQISNYVNGILERLDPPAQAAFATVTTLAADLGNTSLFPSLASGGRLHVIPEQRSSDPEGLAEEFEREPVDYLKIVPSHLAALLSGSRPEKILPRRCLVLGGESSSWDLVERIRAIAPGCRVLNHYGPTEATIGVTTFEISSDRSEGRSGAVPVGRPLPNCRIYLLDARGQAVALGVPGELHIAGAGLARGYLNRPEITRDRFIDTSIGGRGERLYRTGDLARYREDGNLDLLGRTDDQVKLHGFRIEPGEIESALRQHPSVREAVVLPREVAGLGKRLVAYVVAQRGETASGADLRTFLLGKLPEFMLPAAFVRLPRLPLTPNGKIDRTALPLPESEPLRQSETRVPPETPVEKILAKVWAQVLKVEAPGIHDNFFELGGDSILAIQIIARAAREGLRVTPRQLFEHQTVAELARVADASKITVGEQGPVMGSVPLTPIQSWFFERNFKEPNHFNQSVMLESTEPLEAHVLERAMEAVSNHHDALRLRFVRDAGGVWRQTSAAPSAGCFVSMVRLDGSEESEKRVEQEALLAHTGLDLAEGPLSRMVLLERPGESSRVLWVVHHLAVDTVSWRSLIEDLERACEQIRAGQTPAFPHKTTSYRDWAVNLSKLARSGGLDAEAAYWLARTENRPVDLPRDVEGENTFASSRSVTVELSEEETKALLQDVPVTYRTQINDALLTAVLDAYRHWTGSSRLLLDLEAHGREDVVPDVDLSRTVGWFTSRFPVLLERPESGGPSERVNATKEQLRAIPRRGIGYGILRYLAASVESEERWKSIPEPEVSFNYLGQMDRLLGTESTLRSLPSVGPSRSPVANRPHLLYVEGKVQGGRLRVSWIYSENVHRRHTIEAVAAEFLRALRELIEHGRSGRVGVYSPSDFPQARLDQNELDALFATINAARPGDRR
ncbi:MAG: amino acid adenylation domain-containing protein [Acidobacteriota bacterium]|nr:amino acid adenylation domain-containing protein [Acidobacteriota bacterium]